MLYVYNFADCCFLGSEEYMRVVALQLAVISQLLQQVLDLLEKKLPPPSAPHSPTPTETENNMCANGLSKRRRRRRRRRRRGSSEGSSDLSEGNIFCVCFITVKVWLQFAGTVKTL